MDEQEITEIKSVLIVEDHNDAAQTLKGVASRASGSFTTNRSIDVRLFSYDTVGR